MPVKGMSIVAPCQPNLRNLLDIEREGGLPLRKATGWFRTWCSPGAMPASWKPYPKQAAALVGAPISTAPWPTAPSLDEAMDLVRLATAAGVKHGVIQDKVHLPGLMKLRMLRDAGFFGRILSVKLDFGWWVFDGFYQPSQRSSWNYRSDQGVALSWICMRISGTSLIAWLRRLPALFVARRFRHPGAQTNAATPTMWILTTPLTH